MGYPRSFPFALESQEGVQQCSLLIHPPVSRWEDLSLLDTLGRKGRRWDRTCIPISTGISGSHILTDKPEKFHILGFFLLPWLLFMAADIFHAKSCKCVRIRHSLFRSWLPQLWFQPRYCILYCSASRFSWDYSLLSGIAASTSAPNSCPSLQFSGYGLKLFLGLGFQEPLWSHHHGWTSLHYSANVEKRN